MSKSVSRVTKPIPPLRNGDRLSREEFERRYTAMPHIRKAELIRGVVYIVAAEQMNGASGMSSPVNHRKHGGPHLRLSGWLGQYLGFTPGTDGGDNSTLRLPSLDSETQPDLFLRVLPENGGRSVTDADGYMTGAPELVIEIAASSASYDLHDKLEVYRDDGVTEYLIWRTEDGVIDWFALRRKKYRPLQPHSDGTLRSEVFPGLWLDTAALIAGDLAKVLAVLHQGIASPEHAAFVAKLQKAATRRGKK